MKKNILLLASVLFLAFACKSKKEVSNTAKEITTNSSKTMGKVSHQFKTSGCKTVIIIPAAEGESEVILIPNASLAKEFDIDGTQLLFNYQLLRMPQPEGCNTGIPAEIKDISKK